MEVLLTITYTLLFIFLIGKFNFYNLPEISSKTIKAGFLIKVFSGILVGMVYTYYYTDRLTADTFKFFDDSEILFNAIYTQPYDYIRMLTGIGAGSHTLQHYYDEMNNWYDVFAPFNDNRTMIRVNAFLRLISFGYYYVHVVFIAFLSFTGIIAITKVFRTVYPHLTIDIFLIFLLLPSVLFWGSGLLKDALVFFSLGITLHTFNRLINSSNQFILHSFGFLVSIFFLMISKFQIFLLVIPLFCAWGLVSKYKLKAFPVFLFTGLSFVILAAVAGIIFPSMNLAVIIAGKQAAFFELAKLTEARSAISIPVLHPEYKSMFLNAPMGFWTGLTKPVLTDPGPVLSKFFALENMFILGFGAWSIFMFKKQNYNSNILLNFCLFYAVTYLTLIGMVTPILGAIVRYKAQALPFMMVLFVIISSGEREGIISKFYHRATNFIWKRFSR